MAQNGMFMLFFHVELYYVQLCFGSYAEMLFYTIVIPLSYVINLASRRQFSLDSGNCLPCSKKSGKVPVAPGGRCI